MYVASDVCINVAARSFQIYCTWYMVKIEARADQLSFLLMSIWITNTALLPFAGVIVERFRKTSILLWAAAATAFTTVALSLSVRLTAGGGSYEFFVLSLILAVVASIATALVTPLGAPLIPKIVTEEKEIHRAMRLRSSLFIVNLLLGPTLAGLLIGTFGGFAAIWLGIVAAVLGVFLAATFRKSFAEAV